MSEEQDAPAQADIDRIVLAALAEDIGDGDVTTENTIPEDARLHRPVPRQGDRAWWQASTSSGARSRCSIPASSCSS